MLSMGINIWMDALRSGASAIALSLAVSRAGAEPAALSLDFIDAHHQPTTGFWNSAFIIDPVTPANNYSASPTQVASSLLTYTAPSLKMLTGPHGWLRFGAHNFYLNSAAPANQSITVVSGATYAVTITGATTVTASGAATGTWTAGTQTFTAATTTLTFGSTSGAGTVHVRRTPSDSTYMATAGAARYALPNEWGANLASGLATQAVTVVASTAATPRRYAVYFEGTGSVTLSGAASSAVVAGTPTTVNPSTTTLTCTVAGSVTRLQVRESLGIIPEEARTNLLFNSNTLESLSISAGGTTRTTLNATSPLGTTTASRFVEEASTDFHGVFIAQTLATSATFSCFMKAGDRTWGRLSYDGGGSKIAYFNLSAGTVGTIAAGLTAGIQSFGSGWYRCWITYTGTGAGSIAVGPATGDAGSDAYLGDGTSTIFFFGCQLEAGSFPTSYIPTLASTVLRAADNISLATSAFPYSATAWTLFAGARSSVSAAAAAQIVAELHDGTGNERSGLYRSANLSRAFVTDGGVSQADFSAGAWAISSIARTAAAYAANDIAVSIDGGAVVTDVSATMPTVTLFGIGSQGTAAYFNGHIRALMYLPRRVIDASLPTFGEVS